jgi:hypothetical protein
MMKLQTRSKAVVEAVATVLRRMPAEARRQVEQGVVVIRTNRNFQVFGLGGIDTASAMLAPLYRNLEALGSDDYEAYVAVTLPIFRVFSPKAQIGIIAHEFAHAVRALRLAPGWEKKMQARYAVNEKLANAQAIRWGFGEEIKANHRERQKTINSWLEEQTPKILRRMSEKYRRDWEQQMEQRKQSRAEGRS